MDSRRGTRGINSNVKTISRPIPHILVCVFNHISSPQIRNYLVAAGMKTVGISAAGGAGKAIADIITQGYSKFDIYELDMSRFLSIHNNTKFLRDRVIEFFYYHQQSTSIQEEFPSNSSRNIIKFL